MPAVHILNIFMKFMWCTYDVYLSPCTHMGFPDAPLRGAELSDGSETIKWPIRSLLAHRSFHPSFRPSGSVSIIIVRPVSLCVHPSEDSSSLLPLSVLYLVSALTFLQNLRAKITPSFLLGILNAIKTL